jgi:hypothetical protein
MLVDRPTARALRPVRALVWAAGILGLGLIVLVVQQVLAEPAAADTPGLVEGVVDTVDGVAEPVQAALEPIERPATAEAPTPAAPDRVPDASGPVLDSRSLEPTAPVVDALAPVAEPLAPAVEATAPVVEALAPVAEPLTPAVEATAPIGEAAGPVATSVIDTVTPVVAPAVGAAAPVVASVVETAAPVLAPVAEAATPTVGLVVEAVVPVVESVAGPGPGPPTPGAEPARSSPGAVRRADRASSAHPAPPAGNRAPPLVPSPWRTTGADGDVPIPALGSVGETDAGRDAAAGGVPPGPLALAVSSAAPGGLGGSGSGGDGASVLLAILASGLLGLGLARGGVVHDRAARLAGLAGGPGRLPG